MLHLLSLLVSCAPQPAPPPTAEEAEVAPPAAEWPDEGAPLTRIEVAWPEDFGTHRVYLDPGHGAPGNHGNTGAFCQAEEDFNLRVALQLEERLEATGRFAVRTSRGEDDHPGYGERVAEAADWGAEVYLSVHSDNRGDPELWEAAPDLRCPRRDAAEGFSVLFSDVGDLAPGRRALALALGRRMTEAGFPAYRGVDYEDLYEELADAPGVFVDRHEPGQRILVLRRPTMASAIVETHHAWHVDEVYRWHEERTADAFGAAVAAALVDVLTQEGSP